MVCVCDVRAYCVRDITRNSAYAYGQMLAVMRGARICGYVEGEVSRMYD